VRLLVAEHYNHFELPETLPSGPCLTTSAAARLSGGRCQMSMQPTALRPIRSIWTSK
jgi:hypothetical protein